MWPRYKDGPDSKRCKVAFKNPVGWAWGEDHRRPGMLGWIEGGGRGWPASQLSAAPPGGRDRAVTFTPSPEASSWKNRSQHLAAKCSGACQPEPSCLGVINSDIFLGLRGTP